MAYNVIRFATFSFSFNF